MRGHARWLSWLALALVAFSSPASRVPARESPPPPPQRLHGRFLHMTDFHPDEFYKAGSSTDPDVVCHRGKGTAGTYGAETTDCDSPFALVNATLDWIADNIKHGIDFVVWTGDSARHDSDESLPRNKKSVLNSNRAVVGKVVETFASPANGKLSVPVIPTFGNNDFLPHNIMTPGPNRWFRAYGAIWKRFIPEDQRHSFQYGGWFYVEVIPDRLAVFSLNTMFFFERNAAVDGCADPSEPGYKHMDWLRVQLQRMRQRGLKAILMGHVPPARTDSKQNWEETCWQRYTLWLRQYRDVVTASVFGHMNIDHFLLQDTEQLDLGGRSNSFKGDDFGSKGSKTRQDTTGSNGSVSIQSKKDYLLELRDEWSDLPDSVLRTLEEGGDDDGSDENISKHKKHKKKHKYRNIGGRHAERYHVSFVSPSVVPNYLPTLRVFEYNITGLEHAALWKDPFDAAALQSQNEDEEETHTELKRQVTIEGHNGRKKKDDKKDKDHDDLIVPEAPPKESLPGPAHHAQPLTLTGYVQYYANLTHLNGDVHGTKPRAFEYQVEYSTAEDSFYRIQDLTVKRFLRLAYRMRRGKQKKAEAHAQQHDDDDDDDDDEVDWLEGDNIDAEKKRNGKRKGKKRREKNETWLHFLGHAFVKTVSRKDLAKL